VPLSVIDGATMTFEEAIDNLAMPESAGDTAHSRPNRNLSKKHFYYYQGERMDKTIWEEILLTC
jgi:hypothetical protein